MKNFVYFCAAVLLCVSCGNTGKAVKYPNMVADIDPFPIGSVSASLDQMLSSQVKAAEIEVLFYPRENEVALEFKQGLSQYRQLWNEEGRRMFAESLNRYKEDFSGQNLNAKYSKSRSIYGKSKGRFQWKPLNISPTYLAQPVVEFGYRFRDDAPYFAVYQKTAKEETGANNQGVKDSPSFSVYFTRAQGDELAKLFDQGFLLDSLKDKTPAPSAVPERDVYVEK